MVAAVPGMNLEIFFEIRGFNMYRTVLKLGSHCRSLGIINLLTVGGDVWSGVLV